MRPEQIPYGVKDFREIREKGLYYVDKTAYIRELEARARFLFFVRPRRFGKTLLCETLRRYYDVAEKENFGKLFGDLAIGRDPTALANKFYVLFLDFSRVRASWGKTWDERFESYLDLAVSTGIREHQESLSDVVAEDEIEAILNAVGAHNKYGQLVSLLARRGIGLYLIIDEYDNFTNEIVSSLGKLPYKEITHGAGFYRGWFKEFKATATRIFMSGVSPVTMDDLTSGFNIATNISQEPAFNAMVGFTRDEVRRLFADFKGCGKYANDVEKHLEIVRKWYDGYCFSRSKAGAEHVFNCDMALYYLGKLVALGTPPESLIDANIRSDWRKLHAILEAQRAAEVKGILPLTEELADGEECSFELVESFPIEGLLKEENFKSLYYYYGIVTMGRVYRGDLRFRIPNECVRRQIFDYMRNEYAKRNAAVDMSEFLALFNAFAWDGDFKPLFAYLAEKFEAYGSSRDAVGCEALLNGFLRAHLVMKNAFMVKPELELNGKYCDFAFFPDPMLGPDARPEQSYVIELKHSKKGASEAEIAKSHAEALDQLRRYAADPRVPQLSGGTPVHFIDLEFVGREMRVCEEIAYREAVRPLQNMEVKRWSD